MMGNYSLARLKIIKLNGATGLIIIKRGVKHGHPTIQVLFGSYINSLKEKLTFSDFKDLVITGMTMMKPLHKYMLMIFFNWQTHMKDYRH
jgi:hypothetical protein